MPYPVQGQGQTPTDAQTPPPEAGGEQHESQAPTQNPSGAAPASADLRSLKGAQVPDLPFDQVVSALRQSGAAPLERGTGYKWERHTKVSEAKLAGEKQMVKSLQKALNEALKAEIQSGALAGLCEDGLFGPKTQEALKMFQKKNGLEETGVLDAQTAEKLLGQRTGAAAQAGAGPDAGTQSTGQTAQGGAPGSAPSAQIDNEKLQRFVSSAQSTPLRDSSAAYARAFASGQDATAAFDALMADLKRVAPTKGQEYAGKFRSMRAQHGDGAVILTMTQMLDNAAAKRSQQG